MILKAFSTEYNIFLKENKNNKDKYIHLNGVFDIFHLEHLRMINYVKKNFPNHKILVAINSDSSVKKMGKSHPLIFDERYRGEFLAELVDLVIIYDGFYDYLDIIKDFNPDFIVKGEEYKRKNIPEKELKTNIIYYHSNSDMSSTEAYKNIIKKFKEATEI